MGEWISAFDGAMNLIPFFRDELETAFLTLPRLIPPSIRTTVFMAQNAIDPNCFT